MTTAPSTLPTAALSTYITTIMPRMDGWCSQVKAEALSTLILAEQLRTCLEIGVYAGRSLIAIALALRAQSSGHIIGIDPWDPAASAEGWDDEPANRDWWSGKTSNLNHGAIHTQCLERIQQCGVASWITLLPLTSDAAAALLQCLRVPASLDLLHIDGNHNRPQALRDVVNFSAFVRPGGVIVLDDLHWKSTDAAQLQLQETCDVIKLYDEGERGAYGFYRKRTPAPVLDLAD